MPGKSPGTDSDDALLRPPQFSLRTLLVAVTLIALLCSLVQWVSPAGLLALGLLIAVILCHVAGNAIGTQLRRIGSRRAAQPSLKSALPADPEDGPVPSGPLPLPLANGSPGCLSERRPLGLPQLVAGGAGCLFGAAGGAASALGSSPSSAHLEIVAVGTIAFAVLGGLGAFAVTALIQVVASALWQAAQSPNPPDASRPKAG